MKRLSYFNIHELLKAFGVLYLTQDYNRRKAPYISFCFKTAYETKIPHLEEAFHVLQHVYPTITEVILHRDLRVGQDGVSSRIKGTVSQNLTTFRQVKITAGFGIR